MSKELQTMGTSQSMSSLSIEDFSIPQYKWSGKTGAFTNAEKVEAGKITNIIFLTKKDPAGRVLFADHSHPKYKGAVCASDDMQVPARRSTEKMSASCMTCDLKEWGHNEQKQEIGTKLDLKRQRDGSGNDVGYNKPLCNETMAALFLGDDRVPFQITYQRTAIEAFKKGLFSHLALTMMKAKRKELFGISFSMSSERVSGKGKDYYIPTFSDFKPIEDADYEYCGSLFSVLVPIFSRELVKGYEESQAEMTKDVQPHYEDLPSDLWDKE